MRKVNEMVKRIRLAVVHVCVLGTLRSKMPYLWGKESAQAKLIENLQQVHIDSFFNICIKNKKLLPIR